MLVFQGEVVNRGQILYHIHQGWGDSVFVRVKKALSDFEQVWGGASVLMSDFSVLTMKIKNWGLEPRRNCRVVTADGEAD